MTQQAVDAPVRRSITIDVPVARAFAVFTEQFDSWWPASHHIGTADYQGATLEQGSGGRWYERGVDGSECDWGRVLAYEPPTRFVLAWHLGTDWAFDPDPAHASEVEVLFTADGPNATRVDLTHRHLERHGTGAEQMRAAVDSPDGWDKGLTRYAEAAAQ